MSGYFFPENFLEIVCPGMYYPRMPLANQHFLGVQHGLNRDITSDKAKRFYRTSIRQYG